MSALGQSGLMQCSNAWAKSGHWLFDDLVGLREQTRRDDERDCSCRWQVDYQLKLGRLRHRHVGRFFALEDATSINADLTIPSEVARAVAYKTANFGKCAQKVDGRKQVTRCKRYQLYATVDEKRVGTNNKRLRLILHERSKRGFDFVIGAGIENVDVLPGRRCGVFNVLDHALGGNWIGRIDKEGNTGGTGHDSMQHAEPLGAQLRCHEVDAGDVAAGVAEAGHDAGLHRIGGRGKDDWNSGGRRLCRKGRCSTYRGDNDRHLTAHQIGRQFQEPVVVAISPTEFDRDGTALGITSFTKALSERREETSVRLG